jgi:phosphatidate cytidylyltransferase
MTRRVPATQPPEPATPPASKPTTRSKWADLSVRALSGFGFVLVEFLIIFAGAPFLTAELIALAYGGFSEWLRIRANRSVVLPFYLRAFPWLFYTVFLYFLNGSAGLPFIGSLPVHPKFHGLLCYAVETALILLFVVFLSRDNISSAYHRLWMTILGCVIIALPAMLYSKLAYIALFWFYASASVIVYNDSAAYFCGRLLGRHRLIALSPNKTVEGFVGALILTSLAGFFQPILFAKVPLSFCPGVAPFDFGVECERPPLFIRQPFKIGGLAFEAYPAQIHGLVMALFGSLVAPFGGFLASGLKRFVDIKDFGTIIPGHGGILDRMDCQLVMGSFALLYVKSLELD